MASNSVRWTRAAKAKALGKDKTLDSTPICSKCEDHLKGVYSAIQCDVCDRWLHQSCAGVSNEDFENEQFPFLCSPSCEVSKQKRTATKRKCSQVILDSNELDEEVMVKRPKSINETNTRRPLEPLQNIKDGSGKKNLKPHDILTKYNQEIYNAFSKSPNKILLALERHLLISDECRTKVHSMTNVGDKAMCLYDTVHMEIKTYPQHYKKLIEILESDVIHKNLLDNLLREAPQNLEYSKGLLPGNDGTRTESQSGASFLITQNALVTVWNYWKLHLVDSRIDGDGEVIAILDTGINRNIPVSLINQKWEDIMDLDCNEHGTKVATVAACKGLVCSISGTTLYTRGVASGAKLAIFKVSNQSTGDFSADAVLSSLKEIETFNERETKIRIVVMSFQLGDIERQQQTQIEDMIARLVSQRVVCVVAGGNSGKNWSTKFPATRANVITVGSVNADFGSPSNFSPDQSRVDVLAPGENICFGTSVATGNPIIDSGTSFAAPAVAGLIALLFQCARSYGREETLKRLSDVHDLKKFLKKYLAEGKLLQPEKVKNFFSCSAKNIENLAMDLD